jgi:hypothetical protein
VKIKPLLKLWKYRNLALHLVEDWIKRLEDAVRIRAQLVEVGFSRRFDCLSVGEAFKIANEYGIELDKGTCYGDCRAILRRSKWKDRISPDADVWDYSVFIKQERTDIAMIQALSRYPSHAICECLIRALRCGVINI